MVTVGKGYYSITTVNAVGKAKVWKLRYWGRHFQTYLYAEIKECHVLLKLCWGSEEESLIVLFSYDGNFHSDLYDGGGGNVSWLSTSPVPCGQGLFFQFLLPESYKKGYSRWKGWISLPDEGWLISLAGTRTTWVTCWLVLTVNLIQPRLTRKEHLEDVSRWVGPVAVSVGDCLPHYLT